MISMNIGLRTKRFELWLLRRICGGEGASCLTFFTFMKSRAVIGWSDGNKGRSRCSLGLSHCSGNSVVRIFRSLAAPRIQPSSRSGVGRKVLRFQVRSMASMASHPMNWHVGSLYSFSDQYRLFIPSHSSFSISGTCRVSHSVSKPASKRSISKTLP